MPLPEAAKRGVSLVTGFLGSGKSSLINTILSQKARRRVAVIENELGEIGIDSHLGEGEGRGWRRAVVSRGGAAWAAAALGAPASSARGCRGVTAGALAARAGANGATRPFRAGSPRRRRRVWPRPSPRRSPPPRPPRRRRLLARGRGAGSEGGRPRARAPAARGAAATRGSGATGPLFRRPPLPHPPQSPPISSPRRTSCPWSAAACAARCAAIWSTR